MYTYVKLLIMLILSFGIGYQAGMASRDGELQSLRRTLVRQAQKEIEDQKARDPEKIAYSCSWEAMIFSGKDSDVYRKHREACIQAGGTSAKSSAGREPAGSGAIAPATEPPLRP